MAIQVPQTEIYYPESDGKLMGETDTHVQAIIDTISVLSDFFRLEPTVLVGGNMMMYYEEGNPRRSISPDTFVVQGVPKYSRRTYKIWEEGVPPTVVFEFTSRSTGRDDITSKPVLYARLGVQEYFLLDPLMEYLDPPFQGFRLVNGHYEQLSTDGAGRLRSEALGLWLQHEGSRLRFIDIRSGEPLLWPDEAAESNRQAIVRARAEAEARRRAEEQLAELQAELARIRDASSS
jgi:Uma2 family endonuclease